MDKGRKILLQRGDISEIMKKHGFRFSHKLGQNFIFDSALLARIAEGAKILPGDTVVEVGPGAGTLTVELAERVGDTGRVVAVEIDSALIPVLKEVLAERNNIDIVHGDVMKTDINALVSENFSVVANLPYYITTPVIMRFLEGEYAMTAMTVMVQREVADRICAAPGTKAYGALSIAVQFRCEVMRVLNVPAGAFFPKPKVDSCVIRLAMRESPAVPVRDEGLFFKLVHAAFHMRRKTLSNNLCAAFPIGRENAGELIENAGFSKNIRGEELSIEDFGRLSDNISEFLANR